MSDKDLTQNVELDNGVVDKTTSPSPKKPKTDTAKTVKEDILVPVLFTKNISCHGKMYKIHDIAEIPQSSLDKLPAKSYLVRNVRK